MFLPPMKIIQLCHIFKLSLTITPKCLADGTFVIVLLFRKYGIFVSSFKYSEAGSPKVYC